jgi:hypothetical protein
MGRQTDNRELYFPGVSPRSHQLCNETLGVPSNYWSINKTLELDTTAPSLTHKQSAERYMKSRRKRPQCVE